MSEVQEHVYAIAKLVGIDPQKTPLLRIHVEGNWLTVVYVETDGKTYRLKTEYPNPKTGVQDFNYYVS
jgi:hypothetical protein